jgi:hypothetical protein
MTRAVQLDLLSSRSACLTYAKLCRVIVFGFVRVNEPRRWKGTKLHLRSGTIGGRGRTEIPETILDHWNDKADALAAAFASMSPTQTEKLDEMFRTTPLDVLAATEAFRATRADVALSGKRAFSATGRLTGSSRELEMGPRDDETET